MHQVVSPEPVDRCFFRTIEANEKFVVAVVHDGRGNNYLHVYDAKLTWLAGKKVVIEKTDHSFNTSN